VTSPTLGIWQSHPFTIAWLMHMPTQPISGDQSPEGRTQIDFPEDSLDSPNAFELTIRPYDGFTKSLSAVVNKQEKSVGAQVDGDDRQWQNKPVPVKLLIDGPYGQSIKISHFDDVVLVAGGSGVASVLSHLGDVIKHSADGSLRVKSIVIVWSIRNVGESRHSSVLPSCELPC
jgi:hypothetical protein